MSKFKLEVVKGKQILRYINDLCGLRMAFYREYPYLHAENKEKEVKYFQTLAASEESSIVFAKEGNRIVGAIIGAPLKDMKEKFRAAYNKKGKPVDSVYYLSDIFVAKDHRGEGIGSELFNKFEEEVRKMKKYNEIDLYRIDRPKADLKKPENYTPTEEFWKHRGFHAETGLKAVFNWTDLGAEVETPHSMLVYLKKVA